MGAESRSHLPKSSAVVPYEELEARMAERDAGGRPHPPSGIAAFLAHPAEEEQHRFTATLDTRLALQRAAIDKAISLDAIHRAIEADPQAYKLYVALMQAMIELSQPIQERFLTIARAIEGEETPSSGA